MQSPKAASNAMLVRATALHGDTANIATEPAPEHVICSRPKGDLEGEDAGGGTSVALGPGGGRGRMHVEGV